MKEKELRPIGTEFWYEFPYNPLSPMATNKQHRFLYRVKSHELAARFPSDKEGELLECLEALKEETRNMINISGSECGEIKYEFDNWKEE